MPKKSTSYSIVTFLAAAPNLQGANPLSTEVDLTTLDDISKLLHSVAVEILLPDASTRSQAHDHMLVKVSSVIQIVDWLDAYFDNSAPKEEERLRVQIVGHAQSGAISLGASWAPPEEWFKNPYLIFNSNPRLLLFLARFTGRIKEVMLAGCFVGSWISNGFEINGRTLLFTLAEMWKCKVRGANEAVSAKGFNPTTGWYKGEKILPVGWAWGRSRKRGTRRWEAKPYARSRRGPVLKGEGLPRLASISAHGQTFSDPALLEDLREYFNARAGKANRPHLALPEAELVLHYPRGAQARAQLLCGGQFLCVTKESQPPIYYANRARFSARPPVCPFLSALLSQLAGRLESDAYKAVQR